MDTTRIKDRYEQILSAFSNHEADILIGTQTVSYTHLLPNEKTKFTCALHPPQKRIAWINDATKYAADMNLILAYRCV